MSDTETRRRTGGRAARVRQSVLAATLQAVARDGAESISIADVARDAGVHETSIYRRWVTRENLVLDALLSFSEDQLHVPDTGSLRGDLISFATMVAAYLDSTLGAALARSMATAVDSGDLAENRADFWRSRRTTAATMLHRAAARNEVPDDLDVDLVLELLVAPLHFRMLLLREPLDDAFVERVVDQQLRGITGV